MTCTATGPAAECPWRGEGNDWNAAIRDAVEPADPVEDHACELNAAMDGTCFVCGKAVALLSPTLIDDSQAADPAIKPTVAEAARAEPDYCYNPEDWEYTQPWDARNELAESLLDYGRDNSPVRVSTLIRGPDKWVARVPLDADGDWEDRWFDSEEAALRALAREDKP